jgi:uncharacterized protein with von Willebrand factor type A (vWA) domain
VFFSFFAELREAKVPVSLREHLTLMEAMQKRVAAFDIEDFYFLARSALSRTNGISTASTGSSATASRGSKPRPIRKHPSRINGCANSRNDF